MNIIKKIGIFFITLVFIINLSGCSDLSWVLKTENDSLPIGVYIYYMSSAYSEAYSKVENSSEDILSQKIDGIEAKLWVQNKALESCKKLLEVENRLKNLDISLTDEEIQSIENEANQQWNLYRKVFEEYGISKESFYRAGALFSARNNKLFESIYGLEGINPVSNEELNRLFLENYVNYSYLYQTLIDTNSMFLPDEKVNEIKSKFDSYLESLNNGSTMQEISDMYMKDYELEQSPLQQGVSMLSEDFGVPTDIVKVLKEMPSNSNQFYKNDRACYIIQKNNIQDNVDMLENQRDIVLRNIKNEEYENMITESTNKIQFQENTSAIKKYTPYIFEKN